MKNKKKSKYLKKRQEKLSRRLILEDAFSETRTIAGVKQAFSGNKIISGIVVFSYPDLEVLEKKHSWYKTDFPYTPGFLTYREGPPIILAYKKLGKKPDILLLGASGICHPRLFGMASHLGLLLKGPATIGITKNLLCGEVNNNKIFYQGEQVGWMLKNIYISPGHKISLRTSLEVVKNCMGSHRLPEPLYAAKKYANEIK